MNELCLKISDCSTEVNHSTIKFKDNSGGASIYYVDNDERFTFHQIKFDNCVFVGHNEKKCDFGLETTTVIRYIELKGQDLKQGINQIISTINLSNHCFEGKVIDARLVSTKRSEAPKIRTIPEYKHVMKLTNFNFKILRSESHETINN